MNSANDSDYAPGDGYKVEAATWVMFFIMLVAVVLRVWPLTIAFRKEGRVKDVLIVVASVSLPLEIADLYLDWSLCIDSTWTKTI